MPGPEWDRAEVALEQLPTPRSLYFGHRLPMLWSLIQGISDRVRLADIADRPSASAPPLRWLLRLGGTGGGGPRAPQRGHVFGEPVLKGDCRGCRTFDSWNLIIPPLATVRPRDLYDEAFDRSIWASRGRARLHGDNSRIRAMAKANKPMVAGGPTGVARGRGARQVVPKRQWACRNTTRPGWTRIRSMRMCAFLPAADAGWTVFRCDACHTEVVVQCQESRSKGPQTPARQTVEGGTVEEVRQGDERQLREGVPQVSQGLGEDRRRHGTCPTARTGGHRTCEEAGDSRTGRFATPMEEDGRSSWDELVAAKVPSSPDVNDGFLREALKAAAQATGMHTVTHRQLPDKKVQGAVRLQSRRVLFGIFRRVLQGWVFAAFLECTAPSECPHYWQSWHHCGCWHACGQRCDASDCPSFSFVAFCTCASWRSDCWLSTVRPAPCDADACCRASATGFRRGCHVHVCLGF